MNKSSYTYSYISRGTTSGVPGGVYCIEKSTLLTIGYFNYLPIGGGDDLFWSELLGIDTRPLFMLFKRANIPDTMKILAKQ